MTALSKQNYEEDDGRIMKAAHDDFRGDTVVVHTTARTIESSTEHTVWFVLQYVIHRPYSSVLPFFLLLTNRRSKRTLTG
jgi:hypothetical protein